MRCSARVALGLAAGTLVVALGLATFVGLGFYNIGADDHHTRVVFALLQQLRDRSIAVRAHALAPTDLEDPARIAAGARRYAELCSTCHLAPGITHSQLRAGLYPHPPNLAEVEPRSVQRAFWVIKHGIKMSAMPAWGRSLDDGALWDLVAFLEQLPRLTPEAYQQLSR